MNDSMNSNASAEDTVSEAVQEPALTLDQQVDALKKLKDLMDSGILTQEEFDTKKKEIMGL